MSNVNPGEKHKVVFEVRGPLKGKQVKQYMKTLRRTLRKFAGNITSQQVQRVRKKAKAKPKKRSKRSKRTRNP